MGKFVGVGQHLQYHFPDGLLTFQDNKKHDNHMVVGRKLLHIAFYIVFLRYFSDLTFVKGLYKLVEYQLSAKTYTFTHGQLFCVVTQK